MALNYAEKWQSELIDILIQGTLTSPFITTNVRWLDAKTFHFTQMSTGGYKEHDRQGGWNKGTYAQTDVPFTVTHDRDIQFLVDKADVDETNQTASIQNITEVFTKTQQVPETDAYFFSKVAALAKDAKLSTSTALADYTVGWTPWHMQPRSHGSCVWQAPQTPAEGNCSSPPLRCHIPPA